MGRTNVRLLGKELEKLEEKIRAMNGGKEPWEILPNETPEDYNLFCLYKNLGSSRSLRAVAEASGMALRTIQWKASKFMWRERAMLYDFYIVKVKNKMFDQASLGVLSLAQELIERVSKLMLAKIEQMPLEEIPLEIIDKLVASAIRIEKIVREEQLRNEIKSNSDIEFEIEEVKPLEEDLPEDEEDK